MGNGAYHGGIDERAPATFIFDEGQGKRHGGRTQENYDQLVLELLQDELPNGRGGLLGDCCLSDLISVAVDCGGATRTRRGARTIAAVSGPERLDLLVREAVVLVNLKVGQHRRDGTGEGVFHGDDVCAGGRLQRSRVATGVCQ